MGNETDSHALNPDIGRLSITELFGDNLAVILSEKIVSVFGSFDAQGFIKDVAKKVVGKSYTQRNIILAETLREYLPEKYEEALSILMKIVGPENKNETGMFTHFYWLMPVGKFVELYGLDNFTQSIEAIEEITKRNTGEYAIRPFARRYPKETLAVCEKWARSSNFHLRRLASEGLRPKLPWSPKLDTWKDNPAPVIAILDILKEDDVKFVMKSVANHLRDLMKVNPSAAREVIERWSSSDNKNTKWILRHAQR